MIIKKLLQNIKLLKETLVKFNYERVDEKNIKFNYIDTGNIIPFNNWFLFVQTFRINLFFYNNL